MSRLMVGSFNVNGLNDIGKQWDIKRFLVFNNLSLVGLQDTRFPSNNDSIQKWSSVFGCPSVWSKHCSLLIFDKNISLESSSTELDERVLIVNLSLFSFKFTVAVVYAPVQPKPKINFFLKLSELQWPDNILILGDFNCYLNPVVDCYPSSTFTSLGSDYYRNFCLNAKVTDVFSSETSSMLNISRISTNYSTRKNIISGSRIDAILASNTIAQSCTSSIHIPTILSDHRLVVSIWSKDVKIQRPHLFINHSFASNLDLSKKIFSEIYPLVACPRKEDIGSIQEVWTKAKSKLISTCRDSVIARAYAFKAAHKKAIKVLSHLESNSPKVPNDRWTGKWYAAFSTFSRLQRALEKKNSTLAGYKHLSESETTSPYFLKRMASKHKFIALSSIKDPFGNTHNCPDKLSEISVEFYKSLYSDSCISTNSISSFLDSIPDPLIENNSIWKSLITPIKESEIEVVLKYHPRKKAAGVDGLPYEVYAANIPLFVMIFLELFNDCLSNLIPLPGSSLSKIILLYKKGDASELKNWRPISLTNTDYKILTKVLNNRLTKIATEVISPRQFGFIQGRQIWDNIHSINNLLQSRAKITNGYALFLDMEKAYDRISWPYLFASLAKFKAPIVFINWIKLLYYELSSYIILPTGNSPSFPIFQGLRQGDPLSPLLFNFAIDFLLRSIDTNISGIHLSSGTNISHAAFADDTVVCLGSQYDRIKFSYLLDEYQSASNSKINTTKTVVVKVGNPRFSYSTASIPESKIFCHLGVLMNSKGVFIAANENFLLSSITSQVTRWSYKPISLSGRCIAANIFLLSKVWYLAHIVPFTDKFFININSVLQKWFWPRNNAPPIKIENLYSHRKLGGMSLLDPIQQSIKILSKWLIPVINPDSLKDTIPEWVPQYRKNWLRSLKIDVGTKTGIQKFLHNGNKTGPHDLEEFWRRAHGCFKKSPLKLVNTNTTKDRRYDKYIIQIGNQELKTIPYLIPSKSTPRQPLCKLLIAPAPTPDPYWTKIWYSCHSKLIPGFVRTISWRCVSLSWKLADRSNKEAPHFMCPICITIPNTTSHKYFFCPSILELWNSVSLWIDPAQKDPFFPNEDLFFLKKKIPESFGTLVFHTVLSVIHYHFIRASFQKSITSCEILISIFKSTLQAHINRIWHSRDNQIGNKYSVSKWPIYLRRLLSFKKNTPPLIRNFY